MNPNSSYSFRISRSYLMQFYGIKKMDRDFSKIRQGQFQPFPRKHNFVVKQNHIKYDVRIEDILNIQCTLRITYS